MIRPPWQTAIPAPGGPRSRHAAGNADSPARATVRRFSRPGALPAGRYADQQAAWEIYPIHEDVAKLVAEAGLTYTPMLLGRVGNRNGFEHIRVSFGIKGDASPEKLQEIVERAKARSVVYDIVSNPVAVDVRAEVG